MGKTGVWVLIAAAAAGIAYVAGRADAPEPELPPPWLEYSPAAAAAPPAASTAPLAEAVNRATEEQRRANQAAEREARRDRYGY